jgi:hypothetical protein
MIKSTNRDVFSDNLRIAILSDEIAAALRHVSQGETLRPRDIRILNTAADLLGDMRRGMDATKRKKVEESMEASLAYGQAIQAINAMPPRAAPVQSFDKLTRWLCDQLRDVEAGRSSEVQVLCDFFTAVRNVAMRGSGRKFETVAIPGVD